MRDPELDEPVTDLGFVESCTVSADGVAQVRLRLPTYFCAPNFAFLMVADAYDAVNGVDGVRQDRGGAADHFASDAINGGVAARSGFVQSFDGEAVEELDGLRADFVRKAVLAGTDRVCRPLLAAGARRPRTSPASHSATPRRRPTASGCGNGGPSWACRPATTHRCWSIPPRARAWASRRSRCTCAGPG